MKLNAKKTFDMQESNNSSTQIPMHIMVLNHPNLKVLKEVPNFGYKMHPA